MSLESEIKALREALEANTAAVLAAGKAAPAKAETAAAKKKREDAEAKAKTEAAAAELAAAEKAEAEAAAKKAKAKPKPKPKENTLESVTAAYSDYLAEAGDDEDEVKLRSGKVKAISAHFGVKRLREISEEHFEAAMAFLEVIADGGDPDFGEEEEEEDGLV